MQSFNKAKESTLLTLCKEQYNQLKNEMDQLALEKKNKKTNTSTTTSTTTSTPTTTSTQTTPTTSSTPTCTTSLNIQATKPYRNPKR